MNFGLLGKEQDDEPAKRRRTNSDLKIIDGQNDPSEEGKEPLAIMSRFILPIRFVCVYLICPNPISVLRYICVTECVYVNLLLY